METLYARVMVGKRTNAGITAINEKIKTIAQENGAVFLDLTKELSDENGDLKRALHTTDSTPRRRLCRHHRKNSAFA